MPGGTRSYNKEVCHSEPLVSLFSPNFNLMSQFTKGHAQDLLELVISNQNCHKKLSDFGKKIKYHNFISFHAKRFKSKK